MPGQVIIDMQNKGVELMTERAEWRKTQYDFRCSQCNKLLGKIEGKAEIICPRCKTMNIHKNEWFDENDKCTRCGKTVGLEFHFAHANNCRNTNPFGFVRLNEE